METVVNVVHAQPKKYGMDFNVTVSYLGRMVRKKNLMMQSVHITKTRSQPVMPKVAAFIRKVECKKYPKAVWNSMIKKQHMHIPKLLINRASGPP